MVAQLIDSRLPETSVHAIARASGAPVIPEVDRAEEMMPSADQALATVTMVAPPPPAPLHSVPQPAAAVGPVISSPFVEAARLPDYPDELDPLQSWALWRKDTGALMLMSLIAGGLFLLIKALPALTSSSAETALLGLLSPVGFMLTCLVIGVGSVYLIAKLFEADMGPFWLIVLQTLALNSILDLSITGLGYINDGVVTTSLAVPLGLVLARWMFRFDLAQMTVALVINLSARLFLVGMIFGWT